MAYKMDITNCAKALADARGVHDEVASRLKGIESEMTAARNKLNEAQKTFDAAVAEVKADAPWNTKWHSDRQSPRAVA